ncbi:MAG TPA: hypothetical protein VFM99_07680, partial [Chitinophagales bacterium]|nr:hypothetical protein [Chitinophagales bacterium]
GKALWLGFVWGIMAVWGCIALYWGLLCLFGLYIILKYMRKKIEECLEIDFKVLILDSDSGKQYKSY